jgi:adenosylhomocysteinase
MSKIQDSSLAFKGKCSYLWAKSHMKILENSIQKMTGAKPLKGYAVASGLQLTKETAVLLVGLKRLGADVVACGGNPLTTQDDVAAFLDSQGITVYAWSGQSQSDYAWCQSMVISCKPNLIMDDGGDLNVKAHLAKNKIFGATEETTTGITRYMAMQKKGILRYPIIAVNNARTKMMFDNRYGTGQSTIDAMLRASNLLLASKKIVVAGYGWLGKGIAKRFAGMGSKIIITEVDPVKALEAHMDGFEVTTMDKASRVGDFFITCTGMRDVIRHRHILQMKNGAILANAGHFDVEIDVKFLLGCTARQVRPNLDECALPNGNRIYLVGKGRVANLVASEGHPPDVMALSFSNQLHCLLHVLRNHHKMKNRVYDVPKEIDDAVARDALKTDGIRIDRLSEKQLNYLQSSRARNNTENL